MEPLLALLVIIYKVALQQLAFGSQHIQSVHGIRSIEVQVGYELIGGERTMGFGVTGHATSHIIIGKLIPESVLPSSCSTSRITSGLSTCAISVVPSKRSSTCGSRDSSCALRSA